MAGRENGRLTGNEKRQRLEQLESVVSQKQLWFAGVFEAGSSVSFGVRHTVRRGKERDWAWTMLSFNDNS